MSSEGNTGAEAGAAATADAGGGPARPAAALEVRGFERRDTPAVIALWRLCELIRPWNDPRLDIERRLCLADGLFLVGTEGTAAAAPVIAVAMGGYEGHRGWINYLAVHPTRRGRGHGRAMVRALERRLLARGCPKINLQVREENRAALDFYARLGFGVDRSISLGKRLIADD